MVKIIRDPNIKDITEAWAGGDYIKIHKDVGLSGNSVAGLFCALHELGHVQDKINWKTFDREIEAWDYAERCVKQKYHKKLQEFYYVLLEPYAEGRGWNSSDATKLRKVFPEDAYRIF